LKKIISIITVAALLMAMTVTAFAFPDPSGDKAAWKEAVNFKPEKYDAAKVSGSIDIDASFAVDDAYSADPIPVGGLTDYNNLDSSNGAIGLAHIAWDDDYLYIHFAVEDDTKHVGGSYNEDSIEIYLDYDQGADGQKALWNKVSSSDTYSAQYRVQRGDDTISAAVSGNSTMISLADRSEVAVEDTGTGYVVEAKMPLKDANGNYIPKSNLIGFELQINDNPDGNMRQSAAYIQGGIQYYAYEYSHLFDTLVLKGGEGIAWSSRTVETDINDKLATFDPNSVYVPSKTPSKASSAASKATSSKATLSKAASSKATSSKATSSKASSVAASVASTVSDTVSTASTNETKFVKPDNYASVVLVTINPQFNLYLDVSNDVLAVEPINNDAKSVIGNVTKTKGSFETVINSLIYAVSKGGFAKDNALTVNFEIAEVKNQDVKTDSILNDIKEAAATGTKDLDVDTEIKVSDKTDSSDNTIGAEDKGGLPLPALIGIIAGGVLILAGAAVAVILIIKKKGAAPADAEATEETAEETAEEPTEE